MKDSQRKAIHAKKKHPSAMSVIEFEEQRKKEGLTSDEFDKKYKLGKYWVSPYDDPTEKRCDIVRFRKNGNQRIIKRNVPESVAKLHCNDPKTRGDNWFDGFRYRE